MQAIIQEAAGRVESGSKNPHQRFYRPELDVLRFGAFFLVLVSHTLPSPDGPGFKLHILRAIRYTGSLGVPIFFLLSAYLITELLLREREFTGTVHIRAFYLRRILRIWPIYFLVLLGTYFYGLFSPANRIPLAGIASYLLLAGNWYTLLANHWLPLAALPLWSIGIEEQFYLIWPSVVRVAGKRTIFLVSVLLWITCQLVLLALSYRNVKISPVIWLNSFTHFQYFALGALISLLFRDLVPKLGYLKRICLALLGLLSLFIAEFSFSVFDQHDVAVVAKTVPGYMLVGVGAVLLFVAAFGASIPAAAKPFVALGKISYGLYVYHGICIHLSIMLAEQVFQIHHFRVVVAYVLGLPLTIVVSMLSYRYIETPFLRLKERFTLVQSRTV